MVEHLSNIRFMDGTTQTANKGKSVLGKDDFFKLMLQQMKYQDPLNPMESDEYAAQLAQFSSLEQLQNMSKALDKSINADFQLAQSINNTMSTSLIGKEVKLQNSNINYDKQSKIDFAYVLPADAKSVNIEIKNSSGQLIKTIKGDKTLAGEYKISWDCLDNNGNKIAAGNYSVSIKATALNGEATDAQLYQVGLVDALRFTDHGSVVVIGGKEYSLSDIYEIIQPSSIGG